MRTLLKRFTFSSRRLFRNFSLKNKLVLRMIIFTASIVILAIYLFSLKIILNKEEDKCINILVNNSDINEGLVLYFHFNNESKFGKNNFLICDSLGNKNFGEVDNVVWNFKGGFLGSGAFEFKGEDDKISIKDNDYLSPEKSQKFFSVSFWVKFDNSRFIGEGSSKDYTNFIRKGSFDKGYEWLFRYYNSSNSQGRDNRISFYVFNKEGGLGAGSYFQEDLVEGEWIYVTGVINGTFIKIYKNGIFKNANPLLEYNINLENTRANLYIGKTGVSNYFQGSIDELRIYNRALNDSEVMELYTNSKRREKWDIIKNSS